MNRLYKPFIITVLVMFFVATLSTNIFPQFAKQVSGVSSKQVNSIAVDGNGNTYITGSFLGTLDFGAGDIGSGANDDMFFAKYNPSGALLWAKAVGISSTHTAGYCIAVDGSGVYITGYFQETVDFDPGANVSNLISTGGPGIDAIFFAKYDLDGNFVWAKSVDGALYDNRGYGIAVDLSGVYITGEFGGTADFDPSIINTENLSGGSQNAFFAKYDLNGDFVWANSVGGGTDWTRGNSIAVDGSGNTYVTGQFYNTPDFDPGAGETILTSAGSTDAFFAKYNTNGDFVWAKNVGGTNYDFGRSIAVDGSDNVYFTGSFKETGDFDPGANVTNLTSAGDYDIFFAKYDSNGDFVWAKNLGGNSRDDGYSIAVDGIGNTYVTGNFEATADFSPGAGAANLTSAGGNDIFFAKYDSNGDFVWAKNVGGTSSDGGRGIALDGSGNTYVTGTFYGTNVDFDPGASVTNLTSTGYDIFLAKYNSNGEILSVLSTPSTQASNIVFSNIQLTSATISWTNGNGSNRAVFVKQTTTGSASPVDNTTYTASTSFGTGTEITGTGWYNVFNGTGTTVNITNLTTGTDYRAMVVEYNGSAGSESYNTSSTATDNPNNFTTAVPIPAANSTPIDNAVGVELFPTLSWTGGTANFTLNVYSNVGLSNLVYTKSGITAHSQQISGLSNATDYWWTVIDNAATTSTATKFTTSTDKYVTLILPINGTTVVTLMPTLFWTVSNSVSSLTYQYQINTVNTFTDASPTPVASSSTNATTATLSGGQTYYWRARSKTTDPLYSQWSSIRSFTTLSGLESAPAPTVSWPVGDATLYNSTPTLYWYLGTVPPQGATITYDIELLPTSGTFDDTPEYSGVGSSTLTNYTVPSALTPGERYKWRVKTHNSTAGTYSSYSSEGTFNIAIGQGGAPDPVLSWPVGNVTVYSVTPTLYWYLSSPITSGTPTYNIDISTLANNFGSFVHQETGVQNQYFTIPANKLSAGETYLWRVQTVNGTTGNFVSTNGKFTVASNIATAPLPVLSWPTGGTTVYSTTPMLLWYLAGPPPSGDVIKYNINVAPEGGSFGTSTASTTNNTTQSWTVGTALTPGTYYWQVQTVNSTQTVSSNFVETTLNTSANKFIVAATATGAGIAPTPLYPTGNNVVSSLTPTLSWFVNGLVPSTGTTYEVELKPTSMNFDGNGLATVSTQQSYQTITLQPGTQYHWRVRMLNASLSPNTSLWSEESDLTATGGALFTTAATLAPPPPLVGDPINGVMVSNGAPPEISWFQPIAPKSSLKYRLQISEDMDMSTIAVELDDIDNFCMIVNTLKGGTTYYWRVQSKDDKGEYSAHSNTGRFTTMSVTAVDDEAIIPTEFEVSQNYPNPFNPSTVIRYSLPEVSFVTLRIYDILGQEVKTLVNAEKNAGTYNVQWKGDNDFGQKVSSGTYIYRVIAGANIFTKKMVLLR